jgi:uncharacterized BrkB/YihY/UPF0761 family membrane protein
VNWLQLITGLLITSETIILYVGKRLNKEWLNSSNIGYIVFDVVIGTLLIASAYRIIPTQEIHSSHRSLHTSFVTMITTRKSQKDTPSTYPS